MISGWALGAMVSPWVAGYVMDGTGNWYLPFLMSMGLLLLGGFSAFLMHPEQPFEDVGGPWGVQPVAVRWQATIPGQPQLRGVASSSFRATGQAWLTALCGRPDCKKPPGKDAS